MNNRKKRFGVSQALSRGLSETINVVENNVAIYRQAILPLSRVELDPENPRKLAIGRDELNQDLNKTDPRYQQKSVELEKLQELAHTIQKSGLINPIVAYKRGEVYRVVAGERRCLASILAGKQEIEARVFNEKPNEFDLKLIQWVENTARQDLSLQERLGNVDDIMRAYQVRQPDISITATLLKEITGLSLSQTTYYLAVLNAPKDLQLAISQGLINSLDKAAVIANIPTPEMRQQAIAACETGCSLKQLRKLVADQKAINPKRSTVKQARGRALTRVNMGYTAKPMVAREIIHAVLQQAPYQKFQPEFSDVNWQHYDQATRAFQKLVDILEKETAR